jgi:hypothetical protein
MDVIGVVIEFDSNVLRGDFVSPEAAWDWIAATLRRLLGEYGMTPATRIEIRRRQ